MAGRFINNSVNYYTHDGTGEGRGWSQQSLCPDQSSLFSWRELQRSPVLVMLAQLSFLNPFPSHHAPLTFPFFFSHCLFSCPRLNSLTHSSESSPPHWHGYHGDHRVQSWVGGLCVSACVCMLYCLRQIKTEVRACDLPSQHSYLGQGLHTPTHMSFLCIIQTPREFPWISCDSFNVGSMYWYVCVHVPRWYSEHWR